MDALDQLAKDVEDVAKLRACAQAVSDLRVKGILCEFDFPDGEVSDHVLLALAALDQAQRYLNIAARRLDHGR